MLGPLLPVFGKQTLELTTWTWPILHLNRIVTNFPLMLERLKSCIGLSWWRGRNLSDEMRLEVIHISYFIKKHSHGEA